MARFPVLQPPVNRRSDRSLIDQQTMQMEQCKQRFGFEIGHRVLLFLNCRLSPCSRPKGALKSGTKHCLWYTVRAAAAVLIVLTSLVCQTVLPDLPFLAPRTSPRIEILAQPPKPLTVGGLVRWGRAVGKLETLFNFCFRSMGRCNMRYQLACCSPA